MKPSISQISGPTWDLTTHFRNLNDPKISETIGTIKKNSHELSRLTQAFSQGADGVYLPKDPEEVRTLVEKCFPCVMPR